MSALILLSIVVIIIAFIYNWSRRHLYLAASKFRGPFALPIVGNGLSFMCDLKDVFDKMNHFIEPYSDSRDPVRFWFGPHLIIALKDPAHLEKIMLSSKFAIKSKLMDMVQNYLGQGLITASGPRYKRHRKVIQPIFDLNFVETALGFFHKHTSICMEKLKKKIDGDTFNIGEYIFKFSVDTTGEVIAGQNIRCQELGKTDFCYSLADMYDVCITRLARIWRHPDIIYNLLPDKKRHDKVRKDFSDFTQKAIDDSNVRRRKDLTLNNDNFIPAIDIITKIDEENPDLFSNQDLKDHLVTLFAAADDPLALIASFSAVCFGMYPEYQDKAVEEIRRVVGETPRELTLQHLRDLEYLDMCIKDVLRLFPIAPFMIRETLEDYKLDKWTIPKGATIAILAHSFHTDKEYWANPRQFHPDHFLPEAVRKRHIYTYLPFSAGPRGCIGKTFAKISIKVFLVQLLQRFEIEADGKVPDIGLMCDISVRPKNGFNVRLKKRVWI